MAVKTFTSTALSSSDVNTYLANAGLVYVTQVAVGSGVSYVDISACFSATYDNYFLSAAGVVVSSDCSIKGQLLSNTTVTTAGFYGTEMFMALGQTSWSGQLATGASENSAYAYIGAASNNSEWNGVAQIQAPFKTQHTRWQYATSDSAYHRNGYVIHQANTSYNGLRLTPTGGTLTGGTVTVYGYRLG